MFVELTIMGCPIVIETLSDSAPLTCSNFHAYLDQGLLESATFHRVVNHTNGINKNCCINIVQFGLLDSSIALPPVPHENTQLTGLTHLDGTVSLARAELGSGRSAFFISIGDQPVFDYGGERHADGQGFAAFGRVVSGMDVIRQIHSGAEESEFLRSPIPIQRARETLL